MSYMRDVAGTRLDNITVPDVAKGPAHWKPARVPVLTRCRPGVGVGAPGGGQLGRSWRTSHTAVCDADSLEVSYSNFTRYWMGDGLGTAEGPGPNPFLLFAAVEVSGTGARQSYSLFPGGVDVQPGETVRAFAPISVKQGDSVVFRTQVAVTSLGRTDAGATGSAASNVITDAACVAGDVGKYVKGTNVREGAFVGAVTPGVSFTLVDIYNSALNPTGAVAGVTIGQHQWPLRLSQVATPTPEGRYDSSAAPTTDITTTLAAASWGFTGERAFGPSMVTGFHRGTPVPSVLIIGDSISWGVGSSGQDSGWAVRKLETSQIAHQVTAMGGTTEYSFSTAVRRMLQMNLLGETYFTHAIDALGTNDLGFAFATMAANALTTATVLSRRGVKVWTCTCLPNTAPGNETNRVGFNTWLRSGAPIDPSTKLYVAVGTPGALLAGQPGHPMHGYIEAANVVETAQNSGVWASGMTSDGVHPTEAGHAALAAALDVSRFTL